MSCLVQEKQVQPRRHPLFHARPPAYLSTGFAAFCSEALALGAAEAGAGVGGGGIGGGTVLPPGGSLDPHAPGLLSCTSWHLLQSAPLIFVQRHL